MAAATDTSTAAAHRALREGAGVLDRSELGKLALTGAQAKELLNGQVSNDVEALEPGTGCYATLLTNKGKMLGDLRILDTGTELLLLTERVSLQALFDQLRRGAIGWQADLHKRTLQQGLVSVIGPRARDVAGAGELPAAEHANRRAELGGAPVLLVATDLGVDVVCAADDTARVRGALLAAGAVEVDEVAAEVARVESGRPRYGIDTDATTIPQEAGLNERAVSFTKGCYVGQETVARLHWRGKPNRQLRGLRLSAPAPTGAPLRLGEREVGRLGSVAVSPRFGPIALAIVRREVAVGDTLAVGDGAVRAEVVELPFAAG
ncbi:MAG TPA: glycine cleavage T C-terminal barrel domain-containing protein [Solirubrobacteraceae bacterium]|nr:glycine cleavage T C-terminal barrel domain-containing protein [Solirubrobacteraceae bacterium]